MKIAVTVLCLISSCFLSAQSIVGKWKTIDDNTEKARSVVDIYKKGDKYFGKIVKVFPEPGETDDPICDKCPDDLKNKKVVGLEIIKNLKKNNNSEEYTDGEILDPESGNVYDCKVWISEDGTLKVRGYVYFMYRTQTWLPFNE